MILALSFLENAFVMLMSTFGILMFVGYIVGGVLNCIAEFKEPDRPYRPRRRDPESWL